MKNAPPTLSRLEFVAAWTALTAAPMLAQNIKDSIFGTVTDSQSRAVADAAVTHDSQPRPRQGVGYANFVGRTVSPTSA